MVQGKIAGSTSYEDQTCEEIKDDIKKWCEYANQINVEITSRKTDLKNTGYWNSIPYNFKQTILNTLQITRTFMEDFKLVITSVEEGVITEKETNLLRRIGKKAGELNIEYAQTYKEDINWPDIENPNFPIIKKIYEEGRDFFASLQDAANAAYRLEDYMNHNPINNINISGDKNNVNMQVGDHNDMSVSEETKSEILEKLDYLLNNLDTLVLENDEKKEAQESLEVIREEVDSSKPKKNWLKTSIDKLQQIKGVTEFSAALATIAQFIMNLPN
ncbi:MAG: hypothetical protein L0I79_06065 [Atopostipes sp.]|nr:hypothetical protein [Atopostipes sp.]